jgi:site-specific recombinase XerC
MSSSLTELTDTAYDILKVLGKDADFLYDTIETYIKDAQNANKSDLVEIWQTIKKRFMGKSSLKFLLKSCQTFFSWLAANLCR